MARVKGDGVDRVHDKILLHVHVQEMVGGAFEEFPEHADRHREAEGDHAEVERRQLDVAAVAVQKIDHREADGGCEETVQGVEDAVEGWDGDIEMVELAEDLCCEDEEIDDAFEQRRDLDLKAVLHQRRHQEEQEREHTDEGAVVVAVHDRAHERQDDEDAQRRIEDEDAPVLGDVLVDVLVEVVDESEHDASFVEWNILY